MNPAEMYERIDRAVRNKDEAELKVILCEMSPQDLMVYHCFKLLRDRDKTDFLVRRGGQSSNEGDGSFTKM